MYWEGLFSVMPSDVKNLELGRSVVRDGKCKEGICMDGHCWEWV
jgi:hypothetical protein